MAMLLMSSLFGLYSFLIKLHADGGYQGDKFRDGLAVDKILRTRPAKKRADSLPLRPPGKGVKLGLA